MQTQLTLPEAAQILHYSPKNIRRIIRRDPSFPARRIGRGHYRIDPDELKSWIAKQPTYAQSLQPETPRRGRPTLSGTSPRA